MIIKKISESTITDFFNILKKTDQETDFLLLLPEERTFNTDSEKFVLRNFGKDKDIGLLIYDQDNPCGYIIGMRRSNFKSKHIINLVIAVKREYHGKGFAAELLKQFESECLIDNIELIRLSVIENNYRAISFYLKSGFSFEGVLNKSIRQRNDILYSEYLMYKILK